MLRLRMGNTGGARVLACALALTAVGAVAQDDVKVPVGVEQALAKALSPTQVLAAASRLPSGATTNDFGYSIAVSDKYAVIGSPADTVLGSTNQTGAVYIFQKVNNTTAPWKFLDRLTPGTSTQERFGQSVAVSGDIIVVGAPGLKGLTGTGRAFVYGRDTRAISSPYFTVLDATITASSAGITNNGAAFGESVGVVVQQQFTFPTSTTITQVFVGAPQALTTPPRGTQLVTGAVVVHNCAVEKGLFLPVYNCGVVATLLPSRYAAGVDFGQSLSSYGSPKGGAITLVVGSPDQCSANCGLILPPPVFAGVAYVFTGAQSSWGTPVTLLPGGGSNGDRFGSALSYNGTNQIAIGAPSDNASIGTARIFDRVSATSWKQTAVLAPRGIEAMRFGSMVSLYGNQLAVGAPNRTVGTNTLQGSAFYYEKANGQWFLREELSRTLVTGDTNFGSAVAVLGGSLLVGEKNGPNGGTGSGRVYTYSLSPVIARIINPAPLATAPADRFGTTTVVRDGIMLIGVPSAENGTQQNVGLVRVFIPNALVPGAYTELPSITPPLGEAAEVAGLVAPYAGLRFGHALALTANGNRILIGAPGADAVLGDGSVIPVGAVFVYERGGGGTSWLPAVQNSKLLHPAPQLNSDFGAAIDIDPLGKLLVVGAPNYDQLGMANLGAVAVFRDILPAAALISGKAISANGENVPPPASGGIGDKWGTAVASNGDQAAAGAPEADAAAAASTTGTGEDGYVTVIDDGTGGTFANVVTIEPPADAPDTTADEQDFGASIDLDGGMLVTGAPGTDMSDEDAPAPNVDEGVAYAYSVSGNPPQAGAPTEMEAPSGAPGDKWGTAVAVDGGDVAAGGPGTDVPEDGNPATTPPTGCTEVECVDQGAVTTYECKDVDGVVVCGYTDTIYGKDATADEAIGSSVALDGETLATGAPDAGASDQGAVYAAEDQFLTDGVFRDGFE